MGNKSTKKIPQPANTEDVTFPKNLKAKNVFLSYNMVEAQLIVNMMYLMFDKSKGKIFLAEKRALNATWKNFFREGIDSADTVIVFFTNSYYNTKYTKIEFDDFVKQGKRMFVFVDDENQDRLNKIVQYAKTNILSNNIRKDQEQITVIKLQSSFEGVSQIIFNSEVTRVNSAANEYDQLFKLAAFNEADSLEITNYLPYIAPAFEGAIDRALNKIKENSHVPLILIDKEEMVEFKSTPDMSFSYVGYNKLHSLAFIIPNGPNKYLIKGPKDISKCTFVHIGSLYLNLVDIECEEPVSFEGTLVELLEKYKLHDDVQIMFLAELQKQENTYVESSIQYLVISVLRNLFHNYNPKIE